jgi:hypothetical protein
MIISFVIVALLSFVVPSLPERWHLTKCVFAHATIG